jgi:glycyl-tRNA synthetase alpha chain
MLFQLFDVYEAECKRVLQAKLPLPAYDYCLKCSHTFNNLDARGAISVTERAAYIGRVRALAHECARGYLESREALGFPLLPPAQRKIELEKARAARENVSNG